MRELLSGKEVETEYGLTVPWQRKMRSLRRGPKFIRIGRLVKYRRTDLLAFLNHHVVEPLSTRSESQPNRKGT